MKTTIKHVIIFSIAMALLEASVVIYLRELYYPKGFTVAMKMIQEKILLTEIAREAATIVMLTFISLIAGKNRTQHFAFFLLSFAVWDLFYYVWLKLFIDWPESLFTWDILFLIPVTWLGPVLAPVICSVTMILLSIVLLKVDKEQKQFKLKKSDWLFLITGSLIITFTFIKEYTFIIIENGLIQDLSSLIQNKKFIAITSSFIPDSYDWLLFGIGEGILIIAISIITLRNLHFKTSLYTGYESL